MSALEEAWNRAEPTLSSLARQISQRIPQRIVRVGQLDAELLDQELAQLLQEPLHKALSLIRTSLKAKYEHEIWLFVHLVLYKLSIWDTGASYGSKLQDLRYAITSPTSGSLTPSNLPRRTILLHGVLTVLMPYLHARTRTHALSRSWPDAPSSDSRRRAWSLVTSLESTHAFLALVNFVVFLWNGRYRTLADRLLGLHLMPSRRISKRDISYEFMNRQMVWHAFTEFLIFLLPLINGRGIRRRLYRLAYSASVTLKALISNAIGKKSTATPEVAPRPNKRGKFWSLPRDQCAACAETASFSLRLTEPGDAASSYPRQRSPEPGDQSLSEPPPHPVSLPYVASCGDVYCYHCVAEQMIHAAEDGDPTWECLRCGALITGAERLQVDIEDNGSDYDFTDEELESTDLSGSVDSYLYSESDVA